MLLNVALGCKGLSKILQFSKLPRVSFLVKFEAAWHQNLAFPFSQHALLSVKSYISNFFPACKRKYQSSRKLLKMELCFIAQVLGLGLNQRSELTAIFSCAQCSFLRSWAIAVKILRHFDYNFKAKFHPILEIWFQLSLG